MEMNYNGIDATSSEPLPEAQNITPDAIEEQGQSFDTTPSSGNYSLLHDFLDSDSSPLSSICSAYADPDPLDLNDFYESKDNSTINVSSLKISSLRKRTRIDPCADPDMVKAIKIASVSDNTADCTVISSRTTRRSLRSATKATTSKAHLSPESQGATKRKRAPRARASGELVQGTSATSSIKVEPAYLPDSNNDKNILKHPTARHVAGRRHKQPRHSWPETNPTSRAQSEPNSIGFDFGRTLSMSGSIGQSLARAASEGAGDGQTSEETPDDIMNSETIGGSSLESYNSDTSTENSGYESDAGGARPFNLVTPSTDYHVTSAEKLDPRLAPGVAIFKDGKYWVPRGCEGCLDMRKFCDRGMPCSYCAHMNRECTRRPGLWIAKPQSFRGENRRSTKKVRVARRTVKPPTIVKRRGRPAVKKAVKKETIEQVVERAPQHDKPKGLGEPPVWAESRQELCETLPYYRSYQSGCYSNNDIMHGYLLDGFGAVRDYMDGRVFISHSGGKSEVDAASGERKISKAQELTDTNIKCLINNVSMKFPVVGIIGENCAISPSKVPYRYCVLDYFKVTHYWAEKCHLSGLPRYKFRFERLDSTNDGWWSSTQTTANEGQIVMKKCTKCTNDSPHVYSEGWMCLSADCADFWMIDGQPAPVILNYTENFLKTRTCWDAAYETPPAPLAPSIYSELDHETFSIGKDVSRMAWKGMCCPKCGRCSSREHWKGWVCANQNCDFTLDPTHMMLDVSHLADPHRPIFTGPAVPQNKCSPDIHCERMVLDGMTVMKYTLGTCGEVMHILANESLNSREMGPNWMLQQYQDPDIPFKRHEMPRNACPGRMLTSQFTFNCGELYKYFVKQGTIPFDESPLVVNKALEFIKDKVELVYPNAKFNEILNVAYFESQKMNYHDDGEVGLDPTVASLSLGGSARMRFRIKSYYEDDPSTKCGTAQESTYLEDDPEDEQDLNEIDNQIQKRQKGRKKISKSRLKLDLCLNHGDIMIMHGEQIQQKWEHMALPTGLFRIAATARFIGEANHLLPPLKGKGRKGFVKAELAPDNTTLDVAQSWPVTVAGDQPGTTGISGSEFLYTGTEPQASAPLDITEQTPVLGPRQYGSLDYSSMGFGQSPMAPVAETSASTTHHVENESFRRMSLPSLSEILAPSPEQISPPNVWWLENPSAAPTYGPESTPTLGSELPPAPEPQGNSESEKIPGNESNNVFLGPGYTILARKK